MRLKQTVGVLLALTLLILWSRGAAADPTADNAAPPEIERQFRLADTDGDGTLSRSEIQRSGWLGDQIERFDRVDRDGNGTISLVEIAQAVADQLRERMGADTANDGRTTREEARRRSGGLGEMFRRADTDRHGVVTRDEIERSSERGYYSNNALPSVVPNLIEKRF